MSRSRYYRRQGVGALWISVAALGCNTTVASQANHSPAAVASQASHSATALTVMTKLSATRVEPGRTIILDDVRTGSEVLNDDRLQLAIWTSQDAYLYLAYCSQHDGDSGFGGLSLFPREGGQRLAANTMTTVPATGAFIVNGKPGRETLYLIVSRDELSRSDARLADNLKMAQKRSPSGDCTTKLVPQLPHPPKPVPGPPKPLSPPADPGGPQMHAGGGGGAVPVRVYAGPNLGPAVVNTERGIDVVVDVVFNGDQPGVPRRGVSADAGGIVVARFDLQHVAPR